MNEELLNQLKANLDAMQKQLDELTKTSEPPAPAKAPQKLTPQREELKKIEKDYLKAMENVVDDEKCIMSNSLTIVKKGGSKQAIQLSSFSATDISELDEDGLSTALEPFTNPKRIAILKNLFTRPMTATEISMRTGCVGGQLYHHLNNLENSGVIKKENDKFHISNNGRSVLVALYAVIGGMEMAKPENEDKKKQFIYIDVEKTPVYHAPPAPYVAKTIEIPSKPNAPCSPDAPPPIYM